MLLQDDILPKLMTSTGSYEDLFRKEISKYDNICEEISRNIEAQEQLLLQIQVYFSTCCIFMFLEFTSSCYCERIPCPTIVLCNVVGI